MKKFLYAFVAIPLLLLSGCFNNGPLEYRNELVSIENDLADIATRMEPVLTTALQDSMDEGFDVDTYNQSVSPLISSLDDFIERTNKLGAYDGDDSVQKQLLISINAVKYLLESDIPEVFTALAETPEKANELMSSFVEKTAAMQKYDDDLQSALQAFDKKYDIEAEYK